MSLLHNLVLLGQDAAAAADEVVPFHRETWFRVLIAALVIALPFYLGRLIARSIRMPDYANRIGLVLCSIAAGVAIVSLGWPPKLGIDLSGGVILVYEVKEEGLSADLNQIALRIRERLANSDVQGATVRQVPPQRIEVAVDKGDPAEVKRVDDLVSRIVLDDGALTFAEQREEEDRSVLVYQVEGATGLDRAVMDNLISAISRRVDPGGVQEVTIRQYGNRQIEIIVPKIDDAEIEDLKRRVSTGGRLQFRIVAHPLFNRDIIDRALKNPKVQDVRIGDEVVAMWVQLDTEQLPLEENPSLVTREGRRGTTEVLVLEDPYDVGGHHLQNARRSVDEQGRDAIGFTFNSRGARLFGQLTGNNLPDSAGQEKPLGIVLDNKLMSVANIQERITESGIIKGRFDLEYVDFVVSILNAGSLPAVLNEEPISQQKISPQLGAETVEQGRRSMIISMIVVLLFTAFYYRFSGIVACIALVTNFLLLVAVMILIKAAFTLPGLAGLVLSIGMAVDANVLIFERMREELERGSALRMAIRNGFSRATTTIIDSNLTTLITAVVLFWIGSDQVKGFAVTLILGILLSMYTAIYLARLFFDIADRKRLISTLTMTKIMGKTNFDFLGKRRLAIAISALIIAIGIGAMIGRGVNLFDIDFVGGSSVQVALTREMNVAEVREKLAQEVDGQPVLPDVVVSSVEEGTTATQFKIDTSEPDLSVVQRRLREVFGEDLRTYSMQVGEVAMVGPADAGQQPGVGNNDAPGTTPETNEGVRLLPSADGMLAMATDVPVLLAQANDAEQPDAEDKPADTDPEPAAESAEAPGEAISSAAEPAGEPTTGSDRPAGQGTRPAGEATGSAAAPVVENPAAAEATAPAADPFAGGASVELRFGEKITYEVLTNRIAEIIEELASSRKISRRPSFDVFNPDHQPGESHAYDTWELKILLPPEEARSVAQTLEAELEETPVFLSATKIGGRVAGDMTQQAVMALLASCVFIVAYIWLRFQHLTFGLAAIVALVHDLTITVGILAISAYLAPYLGFLMVEPFKISLSVMAAILTVMGYSLNDTIVVFDRIREVRGKSPELTESMVNLSVNQTLARTLLTGVTTLMVILILYIWGGPGLHAFAFTLLVGIIVGTFSSIYIAAPVLLWMSNRSKEQQRPLARQGKPQTSATA